MKIRIFAGLVGAILLADTVQAQPREVEPSDLRACRNEMSEAKRLRCYDLALDTALGVDEKLMARREEFRRGRFGLPVDDTGMRLTELQATVSRVDEDLRRGGVILALDNGQVWQLLSDGGLRTSYRPGMTVVITESRMGGYRLRVPEKTGFRGIARIR